MKKLSKAERVTLGLAKGATTSGAAMGFLASMLPARAGEYMDAVVGGLSIFGIFTVAGIVPFVVAFIITTLVVRFSK